jgi:inner membrane protein
MKGRTHILFGLLLSLALLEYVFMYNLFTSIVFVCVVLFASILPDIDYHKSMLGKYFFYLNYGCTHRGFLHSVWGILLVVLLLILCLSTGLPLFIIYAFGIGMFSHLILDALNPKGIHLFFPFGPRIRGPIKMGSVWEVLLQILFGLVCLILILI